MIEPVRYGLIRSSRASSGGTTRATPLPGRLPHRCGPGSSRIKHVLLAWTGANSCCAAEAPAHVAHPTRQAASAGGAPKSAGASPKRKTNTSRSSSLSEQASKRSIYIFQKLTSYFPLSLCNSHAVTTYEWNGGQTYALCEPPPPPPLFREGGSAYVGSEADVCALRAPTPHPIHLFIRHMRWASRGLDERRDVKGSQENAAAGPGARAGGACGGTAVGGRGGGDAVATPPA